MKVEVWKKDARRCAGCQLNVKGEEKAVVVVTREDTKKVEVYHLKCFEKLQREKSQKLVKAATLTVDQLQLWERGAY